MDRDAILETIQRHLLENRDASSPAKLSELVGRIARELRHEKPETTAVVSIIPIEQVAAFVDGDLDHDRVEAVNRSVLVDNSVLAELVAAVRALQCPNESLPPIAEPLTERLLAIHPIEAISNKDIARMISEPENRSRRLKIGLAVPLTLGLAGLAWFAGTRPDLDEAYDEKTVTNDVVDPTDLTPRPADSSVAKPSQVVAASDDNVAREPDELPDVAPEMNVEPVPPIAETKPIDSTVPALVAPDEPMPAPTPKAVAANDDDDDDNGKVVREEVAPVPTNATDMQTLGGKLLQWQSLGVDRVVGLLGRMNPTGDASAAKKGNAIPIYVSVRKDDAVSLDTPVRLRSLALGDAVLNIDSGGQLWMAENTMIAMTGGDDRTSLLLDVIEGTVAIKGVAKGSNIRLRCGEKPLGRIVAGESCQATVHAVAGGVEVQLQNASLLVANDRIDTTSARLTPTGATEVTSPFTATPAWSTSPNDPIDKAILNQLADSTDLAQSLDTQIKRLTSSTRLNDSQVAELSRLVQMRVSLAGERLFEIAADPVALVRQTAVETIALLPKNDPRYEPVWASIESQVSDPAQRGEVDLWMQLIRTGGQPSDEQIETMMSGLKSKSPSIRGLGDVMLRRYFGNPPALNPNDSPEKIKLSILRFQQLLDKQ